MLCLAWRPVEALDWRTGAAGGTERLRGVDLRRRDSAGHSEADPKEGTGADHHRLFGEASTQAGPIDSKALALETSATTSTLPRLHTLSQLRRLPGVLEPPG